MVEELIHQMLIQRVTDGEAAVPPEDPAREGYTFIGWDTDFSYVTANLTVIAQWKQNESTPEEPARPEGTTITKLKRAKKAVTVKWKKQSAKTDGARITGYQLQLATNKKFTKNKKTVNIKGYKKVSKKVKKLKGGKKYYVRIRTYRTVDGKKIYSRWSKAKTVKIKK